MGHFIPFSRKQPYVPPPSVEDWLPENHLPRFIVEVVDQPDLSSLTKRYSGRRSQAYHFSVMLSLLEDGYATGVFTS